jgi:arylformamidase
MCAHNGTHIDAPSHFINGADTVSDIDLNKIIGYAYVAKGEGEITAIDAERIIQKAKKSSEEAAKRILLGGKITVTNEAAKIFAESGIFLIGNESQSVGPENAPMAAHLELLSRGVVILEGIRLSEVPEGVYMLFAAPLNLGGFDGAPCRAILVDME